MTLEYEPLVLPWRKGPSERLPFWIAELAVDQIQISARVFIPAVATGFEYRAGIEAVSGSDRMIRHRNGNDPEALKLEMESLAGLFVAALGLPGEAPGEH